jgi:hypothetical protein
MNRGTGLLVVGLLFLTGTVPTFAQDVEPRRWTPLPVSTSVVGAGYVYTSGEIAFDPVLRVEGATLNARTWAFSFLHAFDAFGKLARVDVLLPQQHARWKGLLNGEPREVERRGLADPLIRVSVNFLGPPALDAKGLRAYQAAHPVYTVAGMGLAVTVPLGEYQRDKLLNLGQNRFVIRPQLGVVHRRGPWSYELTGSMLFFTDNTAFYPNQTRAQDPMFALQGHVVYTADRGWWVSVGAAHDGGGESSVDGVRKHDSKRDFLYGISAGAPVSRRSSIKVGYVGSRTDEEVGADTDSLAVAFSIRF